MASVLELKSERARVVGELRELIDTAEAENRDLSGEESEKGGCLSARVGELTKRIERQERADDYDRYNPTVVATTGDGSPAGEPRNNGSGEFRDFFAGKAERSRMFSMESRDSQDDLESGTAALGGDTINQEFVTSLYEEMKEFSVIRQANPTVLVTGRGDDLLIPKTAAFSEAAIVGEGSQIGKSNPTFEQVKLGAYKYAFIITASRELIEDTSVGNLIGFFAAQGGRALGDASGQHFVGGNGNTQPEGILTAATVGKTTTATAAVTADEMIDLYHSVIRPYRARASWLVNDSTLLALRKLKGQDNQYLWQPGLQAGEPDRLLGRPILADTHVPELATDTVVAAFGDMSGYYIRDVGSVEVVRSDEYLFDTDQIAWRFIVRTDGKLVDTAAVKTLKTDDGT